MINSIDLSKSKKYDLPFFKEEKEKPDSSVDKGWSYSYVYHLRELKNVFIALKLFPNQSENNFANKAINSGLPYVSTPWNSRRILEQTNALKNFGLITSQNKIEYNFFIENNYTNELTENDLLLFKRIYHEYFRFKEIHSWLINPIQQDHSLFLNLVTTENLQRDSTPVFTFMMENRFNDAFIYSLSDNTDIFRIPNDNGDLMRFWDVYSKWGQELKLLEKFAMSNLDYGLTRNFKSFNCVYYINPEQPKLDLYEFIKSEYRGKHINILKLVFKIALKFRYSIDEIKKLILETATQNRNTFSLQRTSEIFLKNKESYLLPKYNGSFISHLLIQ